MKPFCNGARDEPNLTKAVMKRHSPGRSPTRQHPAYMYGLSIVVYGIQAMWSEWSQGLWYWKQGLHAGILLEPWSMKLAICTPMTHPMRYVHSSNALCTPIQCAMYTHPMRYVHPSNALCTLIQCAMYIHPMRYVHSSNAPYSHPSNAPMHTHPMPPMHTHPMSPIRHTHRMPHMGQ